MISSCLSSLLHVSLHGNGGSKIFFSADSDSDGNLYFLSGKRYCHMLVREGVDDVLRKLVALPGSNASVRELAGKVVDVLHENGFTKDT